jgi:hypothetical protein
MSSPAFFPPPLKRRATANPCPAGTLNRGLGHPHECLLDPNRNVGIPQGAKAQEIKKHLTARLKPVP